MFTCDESSITSGADLLPTEVVVIISVSGSMCE